MTFAEAISKVLLGLRVKRKDWVVHFIALDCNNELRLFWMSGPYKLRTTPILDKKQLLATDWEVYEGQS